MEDVIIKIIEEVGSQLDLNSAYGQQVTAKNIVAFLKSNKDNNMLLNKEHFKEILDCIQRNFEDPPKFQEEMKLILTQMVD